MEYCSRCVMPSSHPYVRLDSSGLCSACLTYQNRANIDWADRKRRFEELVADAKQNSSGYDCLIPVSGGKDSFWQVITCLDYGLNPLTVTWRDPARLEIGQENLNNLVQLGVDHIDFWINPEVERRFLLKSLETYGVPGIPKHMALYNIPFKMALKFNIPLLVWAENPEYEYGILQDEGSGFDVDYDWLMEKHGVTQGTTAEDWISDDLTRKELTPYFGPTPEDMEGKSIRAVYLGYYFPWDPVHSYEIARERGFRAPESGPGYYVFDDVDSEFISIHHYIKWYKFGYTRLFDNLSIDIRAGRITRDEAVQIIHERAPETPHEDIQSFCKYLGITVERFYEITERLRNLDVWRRKNGKWEIDGFIISDWEGWEESQR
ncbi:MAG: N-acetyl sugar amidotransferase [Gammaproteobacteria bacterium]|nr:N-acetyl sugar amidotransferase [Gammaproteobacteria bacterium]NIO61277.1 N-acetyl sugar amidotransferase [Gammaproteobacteria bacterium]